MKAPQQAPNWVRTACGSPERAHSSAAHGPMDPHGAKNPGHVSVY